MSLLRDWVYSVLNICERNCTSSIQKACELAGLQDGLEGTVFGFVYVDEGDRVHRNWRYRFCCPIPNESLYEGQQMTLQNRMVVGMQKNRGYETLKSFISENTTDDVSILFTVTGLLDGIDCLWRDMDASMYGFASHALTRAEFTREIGGFFPEAERLTEAALNLGFASDDKLEKLCNAIIGLAGTVNDVKTICSPLGEKKDDRNLRRRLADLRSRYSKDYYDAWSCLQAIKGGMQ